MNASHVAVPVSTLRHALIAMQGWTSELDLHYAVAKLTPGTARFHLGEMLEQARHHEQALRLAIASAEGETLREVCAPLIAEAQRLADRPQADLDNIAARDKLLATLAALKLALSVPEGGAAR